MKEKAYVFTDIHIHNYGRFNRHNGSEMTRLDYCIKVLRNILILAEEDGSDVIFCGDLFDKGKAIPAVVMARIMMTLEDYRHVTIYAISGNHDYSYAAHQDTWGLNRATALETFTHLPNFHLLDNRPKGVQLTPGLRLYGLPYFDSRDKWLKAFSKLHLKEPGEKIFIGHQTCDGVGLLHIEPEVYPADFEAFELAILGHIHPMKGIDVGVINLGSPLHRDAGDIGKENYIMELFYDSLDYNLIPVNWAPKIMYEGDEGADDSYVIKKVKASENNTSTELSYSFDSSLKPKDLVENYYNELSIDDKPLLKAGLKCLV